MKEVFSQERFVLDGEWTMHRATDLQALLAGTLTELLSRDPRPGEAVLDMAAITDLDACGCQLLALFLENLRRNQIAPLPCGITPEISEVITQLGFGAAVLGSGATEKEAA